MTRMTIKYDNFEEVDTIICILQDKVEIKKISKEYEKGNHKKVYIDIVKSI
ncbi:hypothetical protein [Clostridium thermobutyricum]|uniref:hypothetical protein n=1 Tax=Clostridium thermobutyricum TaxID=29372 RepID=UPI0018AC3708|nr:hypothetical protein [Clostridium thermobutyricum]